MRAWRRWTRPSIRYLVILREVAGSTAVDRAPRIYNQRRPRWTRLDKARVRRHPSNAVCPRSRAHDFRKHPRIGACDLVGLRSANPGRPTPRSIGGVNVKSNAGCFRTGLFDTRPHASRRHTEPQGPEGRCWTNLEGGNRGPGRRPSRRHVAMAIVVGVRGLQADARPATEPRAPSVHSAGRVDALPGRQTGKARRALRQRVAKGAPTGARES